MNSRASKRLRMAAVRHYLANNHNSKADPALILKRTYKAMKKLYKATPFHRLKQEVPLEGHSAVLSKFHDARERRAVEEFLK